LFLLNYPDKYADDSFKERVKSIVDSRVVCREKLPLGVIVIYDIVNDEIVIRIYDLLNEIFRQDYETLFNRESDNKFFNESFIDNLFENMDIEARRAEILEDNAEVAIDKEKVAAKGNYEEEIEKIVREKLREQRENILENEEILNKFQYLSNEQISPKYIELLESARKDIVILSGWINNIVIDDKFVECLMKLAARDVLIVMGWGIKPYKSYNNKQDEEEIVRILSDVKTPDGINAVSLIWLGKQHKKEVLVDRSRHLLGSHNWLSYRGDRKGGRYIRGESVVYHEFIPQINQSFEDNKEAFLAALERYWKEYLKNYKECKYSQLSVSAWVVFEIENVLLDMMDTSMTKDSGNREAITEYLAKVTTLLERGKDISSNRYDKFSEHKNMLSKKWEL